MKTIAYAAAAIALCASPALAQEPTWTGEGSFSAGYTTGNTETTDLGVGLKLARDAGKWRQSGEFSSDYGETDGDETKNRIFAAGQVDRRFENDRWSAYGRATHEIDDFSGFDSRTFLGAGLGYQAIKNDKTQWSLQGGPGFKIDEIKPILAGDGSIIADGVTEESFAVRGGSNFSHAFNENVTISNNTEVVYTEVSTQVTNGLALTAKLMDKLSARFSFDVRHDTDAPLGTEDTDTATRVSLVYGFGG